MNQQRTGKFGRTARLTASDMERVFQRGRKFVQSDLIVWMISRRGEKAVRLGISVSRKLGPAVRRNRLKRLLRESFRLNRQRLQAGKDLALYPRPGCGWKKLADAEAAFLKICSKAGILKKGE